MDTEGSTSASRIRIGSVVLIVVCGAVLGGLPTVSQPVAAVDDSGTVEGTPHLEAEAPNARFDPGQSGTIDVSLTNNATYESGDDEPPETAKDTAGEARSVSVNITDTNVSGSEAPLTVETGEQSVGTIADGETSGPHPFNVVVDEDASAGTYELNVTTEYTHPESVTYNQTTDGDYVAQGKNKTSRTETDTITVVIEPQANFEVTNVSHDVPLDGEGNLTLTVNNTGEENVTEATVSVSSSDSDLFFGSGTATSEANVGVWNATEETKLEFRAGTVEEAVSREYPIDLSVDYTDSDGADASDSTQIGITPGPRDHLEVESLEHTIPENGEGTLRVDVRNIWDRDLTDISVTATTTATDVYLGTGGSSSSSTYIEDWDKDEVIEDLTFRVGTSDAAVDREYPIDLEFEYQDAADNQNSRTKTVKFRPKRRTMFEVHSVDHDIPRDGEGTLTMKLEHVGDKAIEDVDITTSTADSAVYLGQEGSASSTTMIGKWDPGENETVTTRVGTTSGALERPYPLEVAVDFTDAAENENSRTKYINFTPAAVDHLEINGVTHNVPCDGVGPVSVELSNTAEKPLTEITATASSSDSEIYLGSESSRSGTATIEELAPGESRTVTYQVGATSNAVNRTYPLDLDLEYTDDDNNQNQQTEPIEFRPRPEPHFLVESIESDVAIGSTGRITLEIRNEGPVKATDTVLTGSSDADAMFLGTGGTEPVEVQGVTLEPPETGTPTAQTYVGNWSVGETRTISFRAGFDENAIVRKYVLDLGINYENAVGDDMPERSRSVGVKPLPEQDFAVSPVESDLYVGEEGDLLVAVRNRADRRVDGVVLTAETQEQHINFYNSRYAVASLDPGEATVARFRTGITEEAEPGPRIFEISSRYRDPQGNIQQTDSRDVVAMVKRERDAFDLAVTNATFAPGSSSSFHVTVTNQRNETLNDIQARLFTDDPLSSEDDSAFIEELDPGESAPVTLDLSVGASASEKTYSASMDFRFDNARGDSVLSDTQRVPITVRKSESGFSPLLGLGAGIGMLFVVAAGWRLGAFDRLVAAYRRRFDS